VREFGVAGEDRSGEMAGGTTQRSEKISYSPDGWNASTASRESRIPGNFVAGTHLPRAGVPL